LYTATRAFKTAIIERGVEVEEHSEIRGDPKKNARKILRKLIAPFRPETQTRLEIAIVTYKRFINNILSRC